MEKAKIEIPPNRDKSEGEIFYCQTLFSIGSNQLHRVGAWTTGFVPYKQVKQEQLTNNIGEPDEV